VAPSYPGAFAISSFSHPPSLIKAWKYTSNLFVVWNDMGIALYEKFGFKREGTHRRYTFRDGGFVDAYSMARLKG
jgi:hypothetical protein